MIEVEDMPVGEFTAEGVLFRLKFWELDQAIYFFWERRAMCGKIPVNRKKMK